MLFVAILVMFAEPQPAVRARVVKTLALLTKADPSLIARPSFTDAVTERFNDVAISVREEAVKLVGGFVTKARHSLFLYFVTKHVTPSISLSFYPSSPRHVVLSSIPRATHPSGAPYLLHRIQTRCSFFFFAIFCRVPPQGFDITEGYLDGLLVRLRDKGVSVRKTVVGILRDVLLYQVEYTRTRTQPSLIHWHIRSLIIYSLLYCSTRYTHPPVLNTPYYTAS